MKIKDNKYAAAAIEAVNFYADEDEAKQRSVLCVLDDAECENSNVILYGNLTQISQHIGMLMEKSPMFAAHLLTAILIHYRNKLDLVIEAAEMLKSKGEDNKDE